MSKIKTFEDLEAEQKRLEGLLYSHKASFQDNIAGIKHGLKPFNLVFSTVGRAITRDRSGPLLNLGIDLGIDLLFRKLLLARAGYLTRVVVPFVVKNLSSHIIMDQQRLVVMRRIRRFFRRKAGDAPGAAGPGSEPAVGPDVLS
ncbi:hypothetical protein V9K67_14760 [Paraflavisolibacter sp. H34]|uniref:hypothetical protein n=1 Tax=Huijunlia imazamoxiresistens TaxID=3127457 RepID=UPI00301780BB